MDFISGLFINQGEDTTEPHRNSMADELAAMANKAPVVCRNICL